MKIRIRLVVLTLLVLCVFAGSAYGTGVLGEIREIVRENYLYFSDGYEIQEQDLKDIHKVLGDPYSAYMSPEEYAGFLVQYTGRLVGIGVVIEIKEGYVTVVSLIPGGPAERTGIKIGDKLLSAGGTDLTGLSLEAVGGLLRGDVGSQVTVEVLRAGKKLVYVITRETIILASVAYEKLGEVGYIKIFNFQQETDMEFRNAVNLLKEQGVRGYVVDLRENYGGSLWSALSIAAMFRPGNTLLNIETRGGNRSAFTAYEPKLNFPLAVLVDGETASAAEVLAAFFQDYSLGQLVGSHTYGKGSVQTVFPLSNGGALKLTTAEFLSPYGRRIHRMGISPDIAVDNPEEQMDAAVRQVIRELEKDRLIFPVGKSLMVYEGASLEIDAITFISGSTGYVPLRYLSRFLGIHIDWDGDKREVVLQDGDVTIRLSTSEAKAWVNEFERPLPEAVKLKNGRSYLPARWLAQFFGLEIEWQDQENSILYRK